MSEFEGKAAIITGGTSGIGVAVAESLAREGAAVALAGRRADEGAKVAENINENGGRAIFVRTDVQKEEDIKNLVETTVGEFGRLDYAVNNAGVEQYMRPLAEQTLKVYDLVMDTNVKGVWMSMREQIPRMLETAGGGAVVNIASIFGVVATPMASLYVASKHAVIGLTKSIALEFAQQNIRVNVVLPAAIETPMIDRFTEGDRKRIEFLRTMHPIGRIGRPEEVAEACLWLCSDRASFVTGSSLRVDGGYTAQ